MTFEEFQTQYELTLNPQQQRAIQVVDGAVLLLAVPGSGKTTVLISRLGYMITCKGVRPEEILTVTYTVAATEDMRRRFAARFGAELSLRMEFRTINGISQKILQYFGYINHKEVFRVADKEAGVIVKNVFHEITGQFPTENDIKNLQTGITYVKNMRYTPEQIKEYDAQIEQFPEIYAAYNARLKRQGLIDYDDQMVYALMILERYPQVLAYFQEKYRYFCVDEAQDTSKIQHDMIALLAGKYENLFMVGDEDQSIYGFRAAYPKALMEFEQVHPGACVLLMETNYRSCPQIVRSADSFIQTNTKRHQKTMYPARKDRGRVKEIAVKSREAQYRYLLQVAQDTDRETAVLYRNNESALPLIDMLERAGISYRMKNAEITFFSHPVVNDICDFIRLALNPYDTEAFLRIYYKMGAGISKANAQYATAHYRKKQTILEYVAQLDGISAYTRRQCRSLATHFRHMTVENAGKAVYRILRYMGYQEYMEEHGLDSAKAKILQILAKQEESLADFPQRLTRLRELVSKGTADREGGLILSTIHSSKGLEYDRVYLADMLKGVMPSGKEPGRAATEQERQAFEEERRLYYVGMTRAKEELYIFTFGERETSVFSGEVFRREGAPAKSAEAPGERGYGMEPPYGRQPAPKNLPKVVLEDYEMGVLVTHHKYGQGVILERNGKFARISFPDIDEVKKISLPVAVEGGILQLVTS